MLKKFGKVVTRSALLMMAFGAVTPAIADEITVSGASCFPIGSPPSKPFENVVAEINKQGKGIIQIDLKGGAPAIGSPFTLTQKMSKGVYDVIGCTEAYFGNVIPEAPVLRFSEHPFSTLRENGAMALIGKLLTEKGIHYVGRHHDFGPFHLWLSKKIDKPDLTGLNLRVAPVYTAFFKSLGATVQTSNIGQIYTYMENGTVQGYGWPALGWVPSWVKVTKYRVDPGFYSAALHTLFNDKKWKSLSKEQQDLVNKVVMEFEVNAETSSDKFKAVAKAQNEKTAKEGLQAITFSDADTEIWVSAARKTGWDEVLERSPEHGAALMKLFTK